MMYRLIGWWYRWQACKMAAQVFSNRTHLPGEAMVPLLWSTTVFFETYMMAGADGTVENFGPKEPVKLEAVRNEA